MNRTCRAKRLDLACSIGVALLSGALSSQSIAETIVLRPDGTGDYPDLQQAIIFSSDGDIIELEDGLYDDVSVDLRGKAITIRSQSGNPENCTLQNQNGFSVLRIEQDEGPGTVIEDLTFRTAYRGSRGAYGVYCDRTRPTILRCNFFGGGIYSSGNGAKVQHCTVTDAYVGLELRGNRSEGVEDCVLTGNTFGMRLVVASNDVDVRNCRFENNETGAEVTQQGPTRVDIIDCSFEGNETGLKARSANIYSSNCLFQGNGFAFLGLAQVEECVVSGNTERSSTDVAIDSEFVDNIGDGALAAAEVVRCVFRGNQSFQNFGGAVAGAKTVVDCLFVGNVSRGGGAVVIASQSTLRRCTFVRNEAPVGTAIYVGNSDVLEIENCLITDGLGPGLPIECGNNAPVLASCTNIFGHERNWSGCLLGQNDQDGNLSEDPLYCDPEGGDFALQQTSPCAEENSACGQIGVFGISCGGPVPVVDASWGSVKSRFLDVRARASSN